MSQKTVIINGTIYDVRTGMPISPAVTTKTPPVTQSDVKKAPTHSHAVHAQPQKSRTLSRRVVKSSAPKIAPSMQQVRRPMVTKSPAISKFAPHPADITPRQVALEPVPVIPPTNAPHPAIVKAQQEMAREAARKAPTAAPKPAQMIKREAVAEALQNAPKHSEAHKQVKQPRKFARFMSVGSVTIALLLLGGYFTYLNMPNLSVRVAAAQAGVNATYPSYKPDGYGLAGAVGYTQGEVSMKFASNSGPQSYSLSQKKSSWDSSAVLDNYVKEKAGDNYITYSERGLTIYTYGSNAAWVNGGVLYTINGDAPLSSDQIRRIATSM
jgi:hypothetical protein